MAEPTKPARSKFQSDKVSKRIDEYLTKIEQNRGNLGELYARMEKEAEAYAGDQELKENRPNTRVNIINANIEGQVATLVENNLSVSCRGEGPSDQPFANWARIGLDWTLRKNRIKKVLATHERRKELFGWGWLKVYFDHDAINGFGLARLTCVPPQAIFIDMKINDPACIQEAEYIAEVMLRSKTWAEQQERYKDRAKNIKYGGSDKASIFQKEKTTDDDDSFWLIQWWSKDNGMLRLQEFSDDGVLLFDSFEEEEEPYYRYNKYPYFLTVLYPVEGELYGFGDGKLLRPLQDMLNDLYDQIRRAARPNRIFFDESSEVDLEDLDEDDGPVPCKDPNGTIRVVECGRVNPALWQLIENVHREVQRVTRFSELMMGQNTRARTATESVIQQQQGNSAVDHKKLMMQETLTEVCEYILDLMMEQYDAGRWFRIDEKKDDYVWIDFRQLNDVPVLIPATDAYAQEYRAQNKGMNPPKWQQLVDEQNMGVTKSVDLDIEISLGAGLPKNKSFLYQMSEKLSQMMADGKNVVTWAEIRQFVRDYLGIPLADDAAALQQQTQLMPQAAPPAGGGVPLNSNVDGLTANNQPTMRNLPSAPVAQRGGVLAG